jgi:hypothetical protein
MARTSKQSTTPETANNSHAEHVFSIMAGGASGCAVEPCACMPMDGACTLLDAGMMFTELMAVEATLVLPGAAVEREIE